MQLTVPLSRVNGPLFRQVYIGLRQAIRRLGEVFWTSYVAFTPREP